MTKNTLIIFTTDNGGESEKSDDLKIREDIVKEANQFIGTQNNSESNLAMQIPSFPMVQGGTQASTTPFQAFKGFLTEGGIRVPFIVKTPGDSGYNLKDSLIFVSAGLSGVIPIVVLKEESSVEIVVSCI